MGQKKLIPIGSIFGDLKVIGECGRSPKGDVMWLCKCVCGGEIAVRGFALRGGAVTCCGKCPPSNMYRFEGDTAYGLMTNGIEFLIDREDQDIVSVYQWHCDKFGYVTSIAQRTTIKIHRLLTNAAHGYDVDHINGNPLDNRKSNLRVCTHQQNMWNMKKPKSNKTGFKGVCMLSNGKYVAGIRINGAHKHLGCFFDKLEAARAYDRAAILYRGIYARTNFPVEGYQYG